MSDTASSVERLESRVLFAIADAELHRPPTALVATGDLNGDSVPDVVSLEKHHIVHRDIAARSKEDVYVWKIKTRLSDGNGQLVDIADDEVDMVANPLALNLADLDGDGAPDLVVTEADGAGKASLLVLSTDGKGDLKREAGSGLATGKRMHLPTTVNPTATLAADVDGDGRAELAVFGFEPQPIAAAAKKLKPHPNVVIIAGASADGRFPAGPRQTIPLDGIADFTTVAADDLTGDRAADFAITDDSTGQLLIWSPRSNLQTVQSNPLYKDKGNSGSNPLYQGKLVGTGDLDGDGRVDLVAVTGNTVTIASLTDAGKLVTRTTKGIPGFPAKGVRVAVGDVTGDGKPDLVVSDVDGVLYVAENTSAGGSKSPAVPTFNKGYRQAVGPVRWMAPEAIRLADFDNDGKQDVLAQLDIPTTGNNTRTSFAILLSRETANGDFYFERGDKPTQSQFAVGDLDGDGRADLVTADPVHEISFTAAGRIKEDVYVWKIKTRRGLGNGTFSDPVSTITLDDDLVTGLAIGDFNGDGKPDVAVLAGHDTSSGRPTGRREPGSGIATGRRQYQPLLRTFAGDGSGGVEGAGSEATLRKTFTFPHVLESSGRLAVADLDRDGIDDLLLAGVVVPPRDRPSGLATGKRSAVVTLFGDSRRPLQASVLTPIGTDDDPTLDDADTLLPIGDLNGDSLPDFVYAPRDHASGLPTGRRWTLLFSDGKGSFDAKRVDNPLFNGGGNSGDNPLFESSSLIAAGDVDGDGRPDVLAATDKGLFLSTFDLKTQSFLPPGPCKSSEAPVNLLSSTLVSGDLDGDGLPDLLAFDSPGGYSAAHNVSAPASPAFAWTPHKILPGSY